MTSSVYSSRQGVSTQRPQTPALISWSTTKRNMRTTVFAVWALLYSSCLIIPFAAGAVNADERTADDAIVRMATQEGYPIQRYTVTTADGYLLGLYRIPQASANRTAAAPVPAVLLMHGLFSSAADWMTLGRRYSLAYALADAGLDVWLGNARGTTFSRAHRTLDPDADETAADFWNYSFHEIGLYDMPAMIDHIGAVVPAGNPVHYVGHSQGCTVFMVLMALRPEYRARIRTASLMAPAVYLGGSQAVDHTVLRVRDRLDALSRRLQLYEVSTKRPALRGLIDAISSVCPRGSVLQLLCVNAYFYSVTQLPVITRRMARNIAECTPNSISVRQLVHFGQLIESGEFRRFSYREPANRHIYGQPTAPVYELAGGRVNVSMQVFYGTADTVTDPAGVQRLIAECEPWVERVVPAVGATHFDFMWSTMAREKIYTQILGFVQRDAAKATAAKAMAEANQVISER